jgi:hypothetical protein
MQVVVEGYDVLSNVIVESMVAREILHKVQMTM